MLRMWLKGCVVLLGLGVLNAVVAQDSADPISGYWKKDGASVYIQIVNTDGVYQAEMIRNDWSPGLVGTMFFENVVASGKKNRWQGDALIAGSEQIGKATVRLRSSGKLTTRLRPGGTTHWIRNEPIQKAY